MEGTADWSAALVGRQMKVPIEFFINTKIIGEVVNTEDTVAGFAIPFVVPKS
jgi:hypothetical protein